MAREILIVKKPRNGTLLDKPINFPPLDNLHLEMMENKKKLKRGLPLMPVVKKIPKREIQKPKKEKIDDADVVAALGDDNTEINKVPKNEMEEMFKGKKKKKKRKHDKKSHGDDKNGGDKNGDDDKDVKKKKKKDGKKKNDDDEGEEDEDEGGEDGDEDEEDGDGEEDEDEEDGDDDEDGEEDGEEEEQKEEDPYAHLSPEEREKMEREEYIWRFRILKRKYKNATIPEYNEHDDVDEMKRVYSRLIKELHLDESIESYWTYLMGGFMMTEFICDNFLGLDLKGFSQQQARMRHKYEHLLIELGEKSYNRWGLNLPVEIKLIGLVIFNAAMFYLAKIIAKKNGSGAADMFNAFIGSQPQKPAPPTSTPPPTNTESNDSSQSTPMKKMRGPSVKLDDIKKMDSPKSKKDHDD